MPVPRPTRADARIVSYSELDAFRQCPLKWKLAYEQRWTREVGLDDKRGLGTLWHAVMQAHYLEIVQAQTEFTGPIPRSFQPILLRRCAAQVAPLLVNVETGEQNEQQALLQWMYEGYVNTYGADLGWKILAVEQNHYVPLPALNGRGKSNLYFLRATIDLVIHEYSSGKVWIVDHKSGKNLPTRREMEIDDQFGLYTWVAREMGFQAIGAMHSAARTTRNVGDANGTKPMLLTERFGRTTMFRTDLELSNLALDAARAAQAAWATRGKPVHSSPNPMECRWKCDFLEPHLAMRRGIRPAAALKDFGLRQAEFNHTERPENE